MNATKQVLNIIQVINQSWLAGEFDRIRQYLHPNVVFVPATGTGRIKGQRDCIAAFTDVARHVHPQTFDLFNEKVEMWDKTIVASYDYAMAYQMAGQDFQKKGREVVVFNREGEDWKIIYRTLSPF